MFVEDKSLPKTDCFPPQNSQQCYVILRKLKWQLNQGKERVKAAELISPRQECEDRKQPPDIES